MFEILDLKLFGVENLVSISIEPSLAIVFLLGMKTKIDFLALLLLDQKWKLEILLDSFIKIF